MAISNNTNNKTISHFSLVSTIITHIFTHTRHARVKRHRFILVTPKFREVPKVKARI